MVLYINEHVYFSVACDHLSFYVPTGFVCPYGPIPGIQGEDCLG